MSVGMPMYFPLEAKHDLCSGMKITRNGQEWLLRHRIDWCSDRLKYYIVAVNMHVCAVVLTVRLQFTPRQLHQLDDEEGRVTRVS